MQSTADAALLALWVACQPKLSLTSASKLAVLSLGTWSPNLLAETPSLGMGEMIVSTSTGASSRFHSPAQVFQLPTGQGDHSFCISVKGLGDPVSSNRKWSFV